MVMMARIHHLVMVAAGIALICAGCSEPAFTSTPPPSATAGVTLRIAEQDTPTRIAPLTFAPTATATRSAATPTSMESIPTVTAVAQPTASSTTMPTMAPKATPSATATTTTTSTAAPPVQEEGRLLKLLHQVDLSLPEGNVYRPASCALDSQAGLLYAPGDSPDVKGGYALAVVDVVAERLLRAVPLPGYAGRVTAVGAQGTVYLTYSGAESKTHLLALAQGGERTIADVELGATLLDVGLATEATGELLYVGMVEGLEVRDAATLALLRSIPYGSRSPSRRIAVDGEAGLLYVALEGGVVAYQTASWVPVWTTGVLGTVSDLALSPDDDTLYAQVDSPEQGPAKLLALDARSGQSLGASVTVTSDYSWQLVGADDGVAFILGSRAGGLYAAAVDGRGSGEWLASYQRSQSYYGPGAYDAIRRQLYIPDQDNHRLSVVRVTRAAQTGGRPTMMHLAEIVLGVEIRDIVPDARAGADWVYVNDSADRVHVVNPATGEVVAQARAGSGRPMVLDGQGKRLYVPLSDGPEGIAVLDTVSLSVTGVITGGSRIALDEAGRRLFVGQAVSYWQPVTATLRVLDAETLTLLAEISPTGIPAYNPLRHEIYVANDTVYIRDGATYESRGELTPDIGAQTIRGCNGCRTALGVAVFPERELVMADVTILSAGKGAGSYPPPRFFDLSSLEPLTYPVATLTTLGFKTTLLDPIPTTASPSGALYTTASYARYVYYQNLVAQEAGSGALLHWRDGLNGLLAIPSARTIYATRDGAYLLALDMDTWEPLGTVPGYVLHTWDQERHRLYAVAGSRLQILAESGGQPLAAPADERTAALSGIKGIYPSPAFERDQTLYVATDTGLVRSHDAGLTWSWVGGVEPAFSRNASGYSVAFSTEYAEDGTVYAGAFSWNHAGYGVWRSTDRGQSWVPLWNGLDHLRVQQVVLSPDWARDHTLLAYALYQRVLPTMEGGESVFRSPDGGDHWELVAARSSINYDAPPLPGPNELFSLPEESARLEVRSFGAAVERTLDGGLSWEPVLARPSDEYFQAMIEVPDVGVYVLADQTLFRTWDLGQSWERSPDSRIVDRAEYARHWRAMALLPTGDGSTALLLGDASGELLSLRPDALSWEAVPVPVPSPTPPAPPPTPVSAPACQEAADPLFASLAAESQAVLGCPIGPAQSGAAAYQPFEQGRMFWRADIRHVYALLDSGYWVDVEDTWEESQPPYDGSLEAPEGLSQPVRGFGKVWRETLRGPNTAIGWALEPEVSYAATWQLFDGGIVITDDAGQPYVLRYDMRAQH